MFSAATITILHVWAISGGLEMVIQRPPAPIDKITVWLEDPIKGGAVVNTSIVTVRVLGGGSGETKAGSTHIRLRLPVRCPGTYELFASAGDGARGCICISPATGLCRPCPPTLIRRMVVSSRSVQQRRRYRRSCPDVSEPQFRAGHHAPIHRHTRFASPLVVVLIVVCAVLALALMVTIVGHVLWRQGDGQRRLGRLQVPVGFKKLPRDSHSDGQGHGSVLIAESV